MPGRKGTSPPGEPVAIVPPPPAQDPTPSELAHLPPKHAEFIGRYLADPNAAKAYRETYPSCSAATAETNGPRLLRSAQVAAVVKRARLERAEEAMSNAGLVLKELECIGFLDPLDIFEQGEAPSAYADEPGQPGPLRMKPIERWPEHARRAIASIKVKHHEAKTDRDGVILEEPYDVTEIRFWDKPSVLKLIGTHHGMRFDRRELTGGNGEPLHPPAGEGQRFIIAGQVVIFQ